MNIKEDIKSIFYLKSRSAELIAQINETRRPVIITHNGEPKAVIQDTESYENFVHAVIDSRRNIEDIIDQKIFSREALRIQQMSRPYFSV